MSTAPGGGGATSRSRPFPSQVSQLAGRGGGARHRAHSTPAFRTKWGFVWFPSPPAPGGSGGAGGREGGRGGEAPARGAGAWRFPTCYGSAGAQGAPGGERSPPRQSGTRGPKLSHRWGGGKKQLGRRSGTRLRSPGARPRPEVHRSPPSCSQSRRRMLRWGSRGQAERSRARGARGQVRRLHPRGRV